MDTSLYRRAPRAQSLRGQIFVRVAAVSCAPARAAHVGMCPRRARVSPTMRDDCDAHIGKWVDFTHHVGAPRRSMGGACRARDVPLQSLCESELDYERESDVRLKKNRRSAGRR